jgi:hypothetical protein
MEARFSQSRSWRPQPVSEGKVKDPPQGQNSSSYMPLLYGPGGGGGSKPIPHFKLPVCWGPEKGCYVPYTQFKFPCEKTLWQSWKGLFCPTFTPLLKTTVDLWKDLFLTILFPTCDDKSVFPSLIVLSVISSHWTQLGCFLYSCSLGPTNTFL